MSATSDRAFFDRWFNEVWNKGNYDVAYEVIDPDFLVHGAGGQDIKSGPDGVIGLVKTWRAAFPDGQMLIHEGIFEGEFAALRTTWVGTHTGDFYGIPPSGKKVACTSIGFDRVINGKVTEGWGELDMLGFMQQMGGLPQIGRPTSGTWEDRPTPASSGPGNLSAGDMKALLLNFYRELNTHDEAGLRAMIDTANFIDHNPTTGAVDLEGMLRFYAHMRAAMPNLHFEPDVPHVITQGDKVFARWTATGAHSHERFMGVSATGRSASFTGSDIVRVANGKIVERWLSADLLRLYQQLDVLPGG